MTNKEGENINIESYIKESNEIVKMIEKLKNDKKLLFHIYDSLKGFDLIMSIIGKEKLQEYFIMYMKNTEDRHKNYSKFVDFINLSEGNFFEQLRTVYKGILENYNSIKFSKKSYNFGNEEIYLRETLEKIKSILENLGELDGNKLLKINMNFLKLSNSNLDFKFTDKELEEISFYEKLENLEEESGGNNLLPFFHLLNSLMDDLKIIQDRVEKLAKKFEQKVNKDIGVLYKKELNTEKDVVKNLKSEIGSIVKDRTLKNFEVITEKIEDKLNLLKKNKDLAISIIKKDIETLENSLEKVKAVI